MGETRSRGPVLALDRDPPARRDDRPGRRPRPSGRVFGTYVHGLFDSLAVHRRAGRPASRPRGARAARRLDVAGHRDLLADRYAAARRFPPRRTSTSGRSGARPRRLRRAGRGGPLSWSPSSPRPGRCRSAALDARRWATPAAGPTRSARSARLIDRDPNASLRARRTHRREPGGPSARRESCWPWSSSVRPARSRVATWPLGDRLGPLGALLGRCAPDLLGTGRAEPGGRGTRAPPRPPT